MRTSLMMWLDLDKRLWDARAQRVFMPCGVECARVQDAWEFAGPLSGSRQGAAIDQATQLTILATRLSEHV